MFSGLMPAMVTPFDERGELDLEATQAVVERFIEAGVGGISPWGAQARPRTSTSEERKRFAEEVMRSSAAGCLSWSGSALSGTRETVELARHAERGRGCHPRRLALLLEGW